MVNDLIDQCVYMIEDSVGNTMFVKESEVMEQLNRNPNWKCHVYRYNRTIGEIK